jgi:hypothetical protein
MAMLLPSLDPSVEEGFFLSAGAAWLTDETKGGE